MESLHLQGGASSPQNSIPAKNLHLGRHAVLVPLSGPRNFCCRRETGTVGFPAYSMKLTNIIWVAILSLSVVSCGISEGRASRANRKASKAEESVSKERLKLIDQYQKCVKKAGGDPQKVEACDSYLKAAEALQ